MRTIRAYKIGHQTWVSPSVLWQAIQSKEDVTVMAHAAGVNIPKALLTAARHVRHVWKSSALAALSGILWSLFVAAVVTWPPVGTRMLSEIQDLTQFAGLAGAVIGGWIVLQSIYRWRKMRYTLFDFPITVGQMLPPPVDALRQPKYRLPKLSLAVFFIIAAIVLNSVVIATPLQPAVVWPGSAEPYITRDLTIVSPFTQWEHRPQYPPGYSIASFVALDDGAKFWVVQMDYYVYRADILEELDDWDTWLDEYVQRVVSSYVSNIRLALEPELTDEQQTARLVELVSSPDSLRQLKEHLVQIFAERYPTLALRGVHLDVTLMTLAQARRALQQ